jgi:hypothetical protein
VTSNHLNHLRSHRSSIFEAIAPQTILEAICWTIRSSAIGLIIYQATGYQLDHLPGHRLSARSSTSGNRLSSTSRPSAISLIIYQVIGYQLNYLPGHRLPAQSSSRPGEDPWLVQWITRSDFHYLFFLPRKVHQEFAS